MIRTHNFIFLISNIFDRDERIPLEVVTLKIITYCVNRTTNPESLGVSLLEKGLIHTRELAKLNAESTPFDKNQLLYTEVLNKRVERKEQYEWLFKALFDSGNEHIVEKLFETLKTLQTNPFSVLNLEQTNNASELFLNLKDTMDASGPLIERKCSKLNIGLLSTTVILGIVFVGLLTYLTFSIGKGDNIYNYSLSSEPPSPQTTLEKNLEEVSSLHQQSIVTTQEQILAKIQGERNSIKPTSSSNHAAKSRVKGLIHTRELSKLNAESTPFDKNQLLYTEVLNKRVERKEQYEWLFKALLDSGNEHIVEKLFETLKTLQTNPFSVLNLELTSNTSETFLDLGDTVVAREPIGERKCSKLNIGFLSVIVFLGIALVGLLAFLTVSIGKVSTQYHQHTVVKTHQTTLEPPWIKNHGNQTSLIKTTLSSKVTKKRTQPGFRPVRNPYEWHYQLHG
ncbi:unnamed protein product [Allacma fusca]|uniref:Uncharacterized protein n=1 Tax=Allacma fusca TaxID=39272 RepID=A0A8J2P285_9HEXA|nr:unnamed protein product [Allacma fusca]